MWGMAQNAHVWSQPSLTFRKALWELLAESSRRGRSIVGTKSSGRSRRERNSGTSRPISAIPRKRSTSGSSCSSSG